MTGAGSLGHAWDVSPAEAIQIQKRLAPRVSRENAFDPEKLTLVAGVDAGFPKETARAAIAVLTYPALEVVETAVAEIPVTFPYVPGLLSFREAPAVLAAFEKLKAKPELLIVDGQGLAHRRRFGIACHLGVLLDVPAIGSAKSLLVGRHAPLPEEAGSVVDLVDRGEVVGAVVRTRTGVKPLYVSIGHGIDLPTAVEVILSTCRRYRLPEPQRAAHNSASGYARA
ncbi:MAG TPA: deoxyribonuclease V [Chloroflexota bacterium]|nr:deoxyribonuclease V [Chloroflexota bacterium]